MIDVGRLSHDAVREALRLHGEEEPPAHRGAAGRVLRERFATPGAVRALLADAPEGARAAFLSLCEDGASSVEALLGRGWWGRGLLPPPLDWLQRRALIAVGDDGLVHPVEEAVEGFAALTLDLADQAGSPAPVRVEEAGAIVVADDPAMLDRSVAVAAAGLRAVAPTVAVSRRPAEAVTAALRAAGVALAADEVVRAEPGAPALPRTPEDAVGPRAIRALLSRAVEEQRQVRLRYFASSRGGAPTDRVVDPWRFADDLLVGYCHLRHGERTFAVDRVGQARLLGSAVDHAPPQA